MNANAMTTAKETKIPVDVKIETGSLSEITVIKTMEMYVKNGYKMSISWNSESKKFLVIFTK